ncbi:TIGR04282 family arsenosugar biosynthesis glycosyltransferase [Maridesulfovibrio zosterae]|uniref:TIGR04282 family arsenosugar biosynthesis glycosyltransferase n=1 Tax=Maridesulfovibrio zosterae TaxID=82171 RepID=UPI0004274C7E|nr:TIGR04282 family arsenosugar biosynthesis glycosyltransferase [Maridesulfovibrio zosterae]
MNQSVLIFIKYPQSGKVKTRLGKVIGDELAALFYRSFVEDILEKLEQAKVSITLCYDPFRPLKQYQKWLGCRHFIPQRGESLGERMENAFQDNFAGNCTSCTLIGSDIPGIDPQIVQDSLELLKKSTACIGPANDGGYYLIGFQKDNLSKTIFKDMKWSTDTVFNTTLQRLKNEKLNPAILPYFSDIDTLDDLHKLMKLPKVNETCPRTTELYFKEIINIF